MNVVDMWCESQAQGIAFLEGLHGMSKTDVAGQILPISSAGKLLKLAATYFGPTRFVKRQRDARRAARTAKQSVEGLLVVEKHLKKLIDGDEWAVRIELLALTGTVDEIGRAAADVVRRHNQDTDPTEAHARANRSVKGGKNTDAHGCRTITVTGPEADIARLVGGLEKSARSLRTENMSYEQAMYDALMASDGAPTQILTPLVVIGLPDFAKLLRHEGDESIFGLTDGTTITGAELISKLMDDFHLVGLYDPLTGPVNLYQSQRLANSKQRLLAAAESLICEADGCTTAADSCADHHIIAYKNGGPTNAVNISKLCAKDNGLNDDDPAKPRNGRIERVNGMPMWVPPDGGPPKRNKHPVKDLSAAAIIRRPGGTAP